MPSWRRGVGALAALAAASFLVFVGGAAFGLAAGEATAADEPILLAAGDIAGCDSAGDEETAAVLDGQAGTILALGDLAYPNGSEQDFANCYTPSWGRHKARTFPSPGNHEYQTTGAAPYYAYFGSRAGPGYYSFDLGGWHIVSLNSNCADAGGCGPGSQQATWLEQDLAASSALCTLAYWHHAAFTSGTTHGASDRMRTLLDLLHAHNADVVLTGHEHNYERFAPQTPDRTASSSGIRVFVVGTGGRSPTYPFGTPPAPNSEVRQTGARGVLKLALRADGYDWTFLPVAGTVFSDSGSGACHGAPPPDAVAPTAPTGLTAASPSGTRVDLSWTAATDDVGVAGYRIYRNGAELGTTTGTTWADATATPSTTYSYHVVAYDAALNVSPPSNTATVTTRSADRTLTFVPTADATIESANPTANFGTAAALMADSSPVRSFLVKFDVQGVGGDSVVAAKLRFHNTNASNRGGDFKLAGVNWSETTVNWQNAPPGGALVGALLRVVQSTWYEIPLPNDTVTRDGQVAFRVDSPSTDGADYVSRQGAAGLRPELVLTVAAPSAPDAEAPSTPTGLAAAAAPTGAVELSWNTATDNVRVAGYRVLRSGIEIASTSSTVYTDTSAAPATQYTYRVVAYDGAGNASAPSDPATVTTASSPRTLTFTPSADATIVAASPSSNFGSAVTLEADASPVKSFLFRFNVSGVGAGTVTGAKLRLHVTNGSDRGGDVRTVTGTWSEGTVTWSNAPSGGALAASIGAVPGGSTQEVALSTQTVTGDGTIGFRIDSPSGDGAAYDSREAAAAVRPQLVLTVADQSKPDTEAPTPPTGLSASVMSTSRIDLTWTASTDDVRVDGYRVFRNGAQLATTGDTTYSDTAVLPATSYSYYVVAYDAAGNVSAPSNTAAATTPAGARTLTFAPTADATILRDTPTVNSGAARDVQADNSPIKAFLLRFDVSGIGSGTVTSVKLRLHVVNPSPRGGDFARATTAWGENTVTWSTAPAAGARLASLGSVSTGSWQEVTLPGAITNDGPFGLRVDSTSSDGVAYDSREAGAALAPQLVVAVSGGAALFALDWSSNGS